MTASYQPSLVLLSVLVTVLGSSTALHLAGRVTQKQGQARFIWLAGAATAMGGGIWSMHFIGMLALSLPIRMSYDVAVTLVSLLVAIAVSGIALGVVTRKAVAVPHILAGGLLMGSGVCAMHYIGMHAMRMHPAIQYDPALVGGSAVAAILGSTVALWLTLMLRADNSVLAHAKKAGAALAMGCAVTAMHFLGMVAAHFDPSSICMAKAGIPGEWLAAIVGIVSLSLMTLLLLLSVADAQLAARRADASLGEANRQLLHLALHDSLTGLPNRRLLEDRIGQAIRAAERSHEGFALMFLDLDRFKTINDSLGHNAGDRLLQAVAQRLGGCLRSGDTAGRLGGDEFIVLLGKAGTPEAAAIVGQRVLDAMALPIEVDGGTHTTSVSVGISLYPHDGASVRELMSNADSAMYHAKKMGRANFQFFAPDMNKLVGERLAFERAFRQALGNGEFELHYQPKVDLRSGKMHAMEALVRWRSPEHGLVAPDKFIPMAEETGLIVPLGAWVLREACRQNAAWQAAGLPSLRVAVNLSAYQFRQNDLPDFIARVLAQNGMDASLLEIEVTESVVMDNPAQAVLMLERLHRQGVHISVDDFGTGYSSLSYLRQFHLDTLKIDRSFIRDLGRGTDSALIVQAVISLAHNLRLRVLAEGVETGEQLDYLRQVGCDEYQGYFYSRPLPAQAFEAFLRASAGAALATA